MHTINNINDGRGNFQFFTILKDSDDAGESLGVVDEAEHGTGPGHTGLAAEGSGNSLYSTSFSTLQPAIHQSGSITVCGLIWYCL